MSNSTAASRQTKSGESQRVESPWAKWLVGRSVEGLPENISDLQKVQILQELRQRLGALSDWERYDRNHLASMTLKRGYREVARLEGHTKRVNSVHALQDGRIVSGSDDKSVRIWAPDGAGCWDCEILNGHTDWVRVVQGLPDGRIVSMADDKTIRFWAPNAAKSWDTESTIAFSEWILCLQVLPDRSVIVALSNGELMHSQQAKGGEWKHEHIATTSLIRSLHSLPDGRIATASDDGALRMWTREDGGRWRETVVKISKAHCASLQVLPNGHIIVGDNDGYVRELEPKGGDDLLMSVVCCHKASSVSKGWIDCFNALPDDRIVSAGSDQNIRISTRQSSGEWKEEILKTGSCVFCLQVLADGRIVSGSWDGTIRIWDGTPVPDGGGL